MKTIFKNGTLAIAIGISTISLLSCKEKTTTTPDLIPPVDNITTFEMDASAFEVSMKAGYHDSLKTNNYNSLLMGIGQINNDPIFGKMKSGLFIQFAPPSSFFSFPENYSLDSAFISLPYTQVSYGDTTNIASNYLHLKAFEVTESFDREASYYSFSSLDYNPNHVAAGSYSIKDIFDPLLTPNDSLPAQLRMKLRQDFALKLFNANESELNSAGTFFQFMKGLYITTIDTSAVSADRISYFNISGTNAASSARIDFYMKDEEEEHRLISFPFDLKNSSFFNKIEKDYTGTLVNEFLQSEREVDSVFIQGYPGFYTDITLKNLDQIPLSVIHKAQILITTLPIPEHIKYTEPLRLFIEKVESDSVQPIADIVGRDGNVSSNALDFMNGNPEIITINGQRYTQYSLNFPRELQNALTEGKTELTLRVSSSTTYPGAFRMIGGGLNGNSDTRLKTSVIYTKIN